MYRATLVLFGLLLAGGAVRTLIVDRSLPRITGNYFTHLSRLIGDEEYQRAERELRIAIALDFSPNNRLAFYHDLGTVLNRRGKPDEAIEAFRRSLPMLPARSHRGMADAYVRKDDPARALQHLRTAIDLEPDDTALRCAAGELLGKSQRFPEAEAQFRKALELDPELAVAHVGLGSARGAQNHLEEAIAHFRRALEIEPDTALAHQYLSISLAARGELDEAIAHGRALVDLQPESPDPHLQLAGLLERRGDAEAAAVERARARELAARAAPPGDEP